MQERLDVLGGDIFFAEALKEVPLCVDDSGDAGPGTAGKMADEPGAGDSAQAGLAAGRRIGCNETAEGAIPERRGSTLSVGHEGPTHTEGWPNCSTGMCAVLMGEMSEQQGAGSKMELSWQRAKTLAYLWGAREMAGLPSRRCSMCAPRVSVRSSPPGPVLLRTMMAKSCCGLKAA